VIKPLLGTAFMEDVTWITSQDANLAWWNQINETDRTAHFFFQLDGLQEIHSDVVFATSKSPFFDRGTKTLSPCNRASHSTSVVVKNSILDSLFMLVCNISHCLTSSHGNEFSFLSKIIKNTLSLC
jgi:hypothetical protein